MLLSKAELDKAAAVDPEVAEFFKNGTLGPLPKDIPGIRALLVREEQAIKDRIGPVPANVEQFTHDIEMRDGYKSSLLIFKPKQALPGPLIVLCFGGGFVAGSKDAYLEEGRTLVQLFGATVVSISYRLAPENPFPAGQLDAWDSMKWIADNAAGSVLSADPSKGFIMGGVSAGGGITAALTRKFQEEKLAHPVTGQWLAVPTILDDDLVPEKYKDYFIANVQNARPGMTKEDRKKMRAAGSFDTTSDLGWAGNSKTPIEDQPRTYFQVDGMDPLRDDALVYDEMLKEAGVPTKVDLYYGCPHAHWVMMEGLEATRRARIDTYAGFAWLLGKVASREQIAQVLGVAA